jgi:hypothetical protein
VAALGKLILGWIGGLALFGAVLFSYAIFRLTETFDGEGQGGRAGEEEAAE